VDYEKLNFDDEKFEDSIMGKYVDEMKQQIGTAAFLAYIIGIITSIIFMDFIIVPFQAVAIWIWTQEWTLSFDTMMVNTITLFILFTFIFLIYSVYKKIKNKKEGSERQQT